MKPIRTILVPIAFSRRTQTLLDYAVGLALELNADLLVANVINIRSMEAISRVESMGYQVDTEAYRRSLEEERSGLLDEMLAKSVFPRDRVRTIFKVGHPFDKLLQIVKEETVDLVVMGSRAHSELEHVLLGSVAEKMFRHSPVPVLSYRMRR